MKKLRYALETVLVKFFLWLFNALPVEKASALGGYLAKTICPHLGINRVARKNLSFALPGLTADEQQKLIARMWEHLGRVTAEFPHVHRPGDSFINQYVTLKGLHILDAMADNNSGFLLFSGHFGNWEILPKLAACRNVPLSFVYRPANNPAVDACICAIRSHSQVTMVPKGVHGAKATISTLKKGKGVAMLVDQKMNDGIAVPFFGKEAMTAPAIAKLALKLGVPVIPVRAKRLHGTYFEVELLPPLTITSTGNTQQDTYNIMLAINQLLEEWIRETPEQWFWIHKRWPKNS